MTAAPARRPNILMVLTDDHAAHAVGAYGSVVNVTPHLDEIASRGWVMEDCFCTNSICTPSRASILTGTHSHVNGVTTLSTPMDPSLPTFVSRLQEEGYRTGIVGKWHLGEGPEHEPRGFDRWEILHDQGEYFDPVFRTASGDVQRKGYTTDVITDIALDWMQDWESEAAGEPWCLLVHHKAPHRPWHPDEAHRGLYADPIPLPLTFHDDYATRGTVLTAPRCASPITSTSRTSSSIRPRVSPTRSSRSGSTSATCRTISSAWPRSTTTSAG